MATFADPKTEALFASNLALVERYASAREHAQAAKYLRKAMRLINHEDNKSNHPELVTLNAQHTRLAHLSR